MVAKAASKKRTSKRTLSAENLKTLGAPRLARLLMDLTAGDANAKRRLRLELAATVSPDAVAKLARSRLNSLTRAETRISWKRMPEVYADLKAHFEAITRTAGKEDPTLALELLWLLIAAAISIRDRAAYDPGVYEIQQAAAKRLGDAASAAKPDPEALAEDALRVLLIEGIGGEPIVPALAPALGEKGLAHLKRRLREHDSHSRSGRQKLLWIADAEGDVDEFVRLHPPDERTRPHYAADIARRLLAAGRAAEALRTLDAAKGGTDARSVMGRPDFGWADARIESLDALGRHDEAQDVRWSCFDRGLSARHLRGWLKRFPGFEGMEAEERAFDHAERYHPETEVVEFLVEWPDLARASAFVLGHTNALDGDRHYTLLPVAEALAARFPLAATLVLRSMIDATLAKHQHQRYRAAARHLTECAGLAAGITDFRGHPDHDSYVQTLREHYGYVGSFWTRVE